ncbi:MAG: hypothetical protein EBR82_43775 [Caulobacteraceae bacterium]|nr:hypothetical protein [Caulobacteraceae bacterium]
MAELLITNQVGAREDLADLIAVADQKSTPLLSMAKKSKEPTNPLFSWLVDAMNEPVLNGVLSNQDATTFANQAANRARLYGRIQKMWRLPKVDDLAESVSDVAGIGRKREMARSVTRSLQELARDLESVFCSDQDSTEQSGTTPYKTRGLGSWISNSAQSDLPVPASQRTPSASITNTATTALTESNLQNVLQSIYEQTGSQDRLIMVAGPSLKKAITNFTRFTVNSTQNVFNLRQTAQAANSDRLVSNISFYEGDFSTVEIVTSLFLAANASTDAEKYARGYVMSPDHLMLRYGRRPRFQELEDQGGGPRGLVDAIVSLAVMSPKAMAKFNATA